ncbi:protein neprosin-like [Daucus carota subsp. sativus]|uniref:protein neprosin-like n=1 Tax=Daucus carota subsp. sativus TaxID=79200 RepID=UPI003082D584
MFEFNREFRKILSGLTLPENPELESSAARISPKKELQVENLLKRLNKTPQKSIKKQSPDGDIIDCIPISQQPAFDHPLPQNHKIQLEPSYYPEGPFGDKRVNTSKSRKRLKPIKQLWHLNGNCDKGTIPVRRTTKEDILRAGSIKNYGKKKEIANILGPNSAKPQPDASTEHEYSFASVMGEKYIGTRAIMEVWKPEVEQPNEFSLAQIWVLGGSFDGSLNSIEAGWQVYPNMYRDDSTRLFAYWTRDQYKSTGCYNLVCPGFVQISERIALGVSFQQVSTYQGSQSSLTLLIWKDPTEGKWWLASDDREVIGYWPTSLFTSLADSAKHNSMGR